MYSNKTGSAQQVVGSNILNFWQGYTRRDRETVGILEMLCQCYIGHAASFASYQQPYENNLMVPPVLPFGNILGQNSKTHTQYIEEVPYYWEEYSHDASTTAHFAGR